MKIDRISSLADYFLICTGTSNTHVKTLCDYAEYTFEQIRTLWEENFDRPFIEFYSSKKWDIIRKAGLLQV